MPTAHARRVSLRTRPLMTAASALGVARAHPEVRLVPAEHLDRDAERAQDGHDLLGGLVVGLPIRRQEHGVGTATPRLAERHARVHAELPGLVRGGGDDLAGPTGVAVTADDHRSAGQLGSAPHLDRRQEVVEVDVEHPLVWTDLGRRPARHHGDDPTERHRSDDRRRFRPGSNPRRRGACGRTRRLRSLKPGSRSATLPLTSAPPER